MAAPVCEQSEIAGLLRPYAKTIAQGLLGAAAGLAGVIGHLFLTIGFAAVLYAKGEAAAGRVPPLRADLAGPRGEEAAILAGQAIRSVALGVVVTALAQSLVTGVGLKLAGVPCGPGCSPPSRCSLRIAQLGPALVVILGDHLAVLDRSDRARGVILVVRRAGAADGQYPAADPDPAAWICRFC